MEEFKDDYVRDLVKKSKRQMPNPEFEKQMMSKLYPTPTYKNDVSSYLILSMRFFLGGLILGVWILLYLLFGESLFVYHGKTLPIVVLFILAVIGILNIENYRRLIHQYSTRRFRPAPL